jgi:hypothetical protein
MERKNEEKREIKMYMSPKIYALIKELLREESKQYGIRTLEPRINDSLLNNPNIVNLRRD